MNKQATENDILEQAIEAIYREAGLRMKIVERDITKYGKHIDAIIQMLDINSKKNNDDNNTIFVAEVKKWVNNANLGAVINQITTMAKPGHGLFVADYIKKGKK